MDSTTLRRSEIRRIFRRYKGVQTRLAEELGISQVTVNRWLKEKIESKRVAEAAHAKALALLEQERAQKGSAA